MVAAAPILGSALPRQHEQQQHGAPPLPAGPPSELNVRQFGAHGDGVTPDDAAIQAAINAATAAARLPNGTHTTPAVYFPRGVYLLTKTLQVRRHQAVGSFSRRLVYFISDSPYKIY